MTGHINPFQHIRLEHLAPSPTNPRKTFTETDLVDLAASIREQGVMQPILVRLWPDDYPTPEGRADRPLYEIIAGERRYRASLIAELDDIPALIRQINTRQVLEAQIVENLQRRDVSELEEAEGYDLMMREHGYTADQLAEKVGKSRAYIYGRLKLTALCEAAREAFRAGTLDASRALLIARIPGAALQIKALKDITEGWHGVLSYRNAANHIQNTYMRGLGRVVFALDDATLHPEAGPCTTCAKRPCNTPELYPDVPPDRIADVCTDPECLSAKTEAHLQRRADEAAAGGRTVVRAATSADWVSNYRPLHGDDYDQPERIPVDEDGNDLPPEMTDSAEDHRAPTVAEMLQRVGAQIEIVLVENPVSHELIECVRVADYRTAVPLPATDDDDGSADRARNTDARKAEADKRWAIFKAIRTRYDDATHSWASKAAVLRIIAQQFWARSWHNTRETVATLNNIPVDQPGVITGWLSEASAGEMIPLLLDLALEPTTDIPMYAGDLTTPAPLLDMARALGVDPENPNAPPPAAPKTTSTPPKAAPAGDVTAKKTGKTKTTSPAKKAAPAAGAKAKKPNGQAADAAKKTQGKGKDSGRASAAGGKKKPAAEDPAPYRCPNTPDMLEGASA